MIKDEILDFFRENPDRMFSCLEISTALGRNNTSVHVAIRGLRHGKMLYAEKVEEDGKRYMIYRLRGESDIGSEIERQQFDKVIRSNNLSREILGFLRQIKTPLKVSEVKQVFSKKSMKTIENTLYQLVALNKVDYKCYRGTNRCREDGIEYFFACDCDDWTIDEGYR